jgi:hypothetical protein
VASAPEPLGTWDVFVLGALGGFISYTTIFWFPWALRLARGTITEWPTVKQVVGLVAVGLFAIGLGGFIAAGLLGDVFLARQAIVGGLAWPAFLKTIGDAAEEAGLRPVRRS